MVDFFFKEAGLREKLRTALRHCPDMERALSRIYLQRGGPRDLLAIQAGLVAAQSIHAMLHTGAGWLPRALEALQQALVGHEALSQELAQAIRPDCGLFARDGNFVAEGYSRELDDVRVLRDQGKQHIAALQLEYQEQTGIGSLKIRYNNVLGYYVEVTPLHQQKMGDGFIHRQTLAGAVRFTTVKLGELERAISEAADKALKRELEIFDALSAQVLAAAEPLTQAARALAVVDVAAANAELAYTRRYHRPVLDNSLAFTIHAGRHPVVEAHLSQQAEAGFIHNQCDLGDAQRLWLLTGPNMAGKSTFLRQNALIVILAQMGCFVPAESAHIGVVDRLSSRVGAADDLARGHSTFMVEMIETATILNQSTARSLVILDEIGRGTATFDGLSIAWSVVEYLHNTIRCRGLFATHYHELTLLKDTLPSLACYNMRVKEWQGKVIFMHEVVEGCADRSYGIHVAALAGLPEAVLERARTVLGALEEQQVKPMVQKLVEGLPLFSAAPAAKPLPARNAVSDYLGALTPDELSPKAALEEIYKLKKLLEE